MAWTHDTVRDGRRVPGQISIVQMYRRYGRLGDQEYRELLHQVTGCRSSRDESLTDHDFDRFMARLETRAHLAEANGVAEGSRPPRIRDWYYWRKRCPTSQRPSSRELYRIERGWEQLQPYLLEEQRTPEYLRGIAAHAVGHQVRLIADLSNRETLQVIDALHDRLAYAVRRAPAA